MAEKAEQQTEAEYAHELVHGAYLLMRNAEATLENEEFLSRWPALKAKADAALSALGDLYQEAGITLDIAFDRENSIWQIAEDTCVVNSELQDLLNSWLERKRY